jgi:putative oxidoreductase
MRGSGDILNSIGLLILRLGVGGYMLTHGWGKLQMLTAGQFEQFGDPIGLGSRASLALVVFAEFFCALAVMLGLATRLAALPLVIAMAVAAFVAHGNDPWTMEQGYKLFFAGESKMPLSKEPALLFLAPFLALAFTGPGKFSIDGLLWPRWRGTRKPPL